MRTSVRARGWSRSKLSLRERACCARRGAAVACPLGRRRKPMKRRRNGGGKGRGRDAAHQGRLVARGGSAGWPGSTDRCRRRRSGQRRASGKKKWWRARPWLPGPSASVSRKRKWRHIRWREEGVGGARHQPGGELVRGSQAWRRRCVEERQAAALRKGKRGARVCGALQMWLKKRERERAGRGTRWGQRAASPWRLHAVKAPLFSVRKGGRRKGSGPKELGLGLGREVAQEDIFFPVFKMFCFLFFSGFCNLKTNQKET